MTKFEQFHDIELEVLHEALSGEVIAAGYEVNQEEAGSPDHHAAVERFGAATQLLNAFAVALEARAEGGGDGYDESTNPSNGWRPERCWR